MNSLNPEPVLVQYRFGLPRDTEHPHFRIFYTIHGNRLNQLRRWGRNPEIARAMDSRQSNRRAQRRARLPEPTAPETEENCLDAVPRRR